MKSRRGHKPTDSENPHIVPSLPSCYAPDEARHANKSHRFWPIPQRMQLSVHCSSLLSSWIRWCSTINSRPGASRWATDCGGRLARQLSPEDGAEIQSEMVREGGRSSDGITVRGLPLSLLILQKLLDISSCVVTLRKHWSSLVLLPFPSNVLMCCSSRNFGQSLF